MKNLLTIVIPTWNNRDMLKVCIESLFLYTSYPFEVIIIDQSELENSLKKIINTIYKVKNEFKLNIKDCFILGFSQGGMMAYEITQN